MIQRFIFSLSLLFISQTAHAVDRPNVIVFIGDDISWNDFGCYGNAAARTPNIDRLAANGLRFDNAYLTASSCSPSRCSIITGRYPHNNGKAAELHLPIAWNLPMFPALLRDSGYHTILSGKDHMARSAPPEGQVALSEPWSVKDGGRDKANSGGHAHWLKNIRERPGDKPFFAWFAAYDAHRNWDADGQWDAAAYGPQHRPGDVIVPPFLIDDAQTRQDLASYYNEVTRYDHFIGKVVDELKAQGELDNTLIFVLADTGRPFPRAKTRLHDSGMKTALVAHWPAGINATGAAAESLVSVIDLAPTILKAAGVSAAESFQGVPLQPIFDKADATVREAAFSEHNWHDYSAHGRSVRAGDFLYIRNNRPELAWQGPADSVRSDSHKALQAARDGNQLTPAQADVFLAPRPEEELYQVSEDSFQLNNLIGEKALSETADQLRSLLDEWTEQTADSAPENLSPDGFDRETGESLKLDHKTRATYTTPGEDRDAASVNAPGPR